MTKISQCFKCDHDRRHCDRYTPEDGTDCPFYVRGGVYQVKDETSSQMGKIVGWGFLYTLFFIYACIRDYDDAGLLYPLTIPYGVLIGLAIIVYLKNSKKRKLERIRNSAINNRTTRTYKAMQEVPIQSENSKDTDDDLEQMDIQLPDSTTRTSLMVALRKLNLQYEFDEKQNFMVTYQGEHFRVIAENERGWIQIQDLGWYEASLDDIDNLAMLHRAVNECNIRDANKIVYTYNKVEKEVWLHTLRDLLWIPQIPEPAQYLQSTFNSMLRSHQLFFGVMENIRREEHSTHY